MQHLARSSQAFRKIWAVSVCTLLLIHLSSAVPAADRIVSRDLTKIYTDRSVESFDEDGVRLEGNITLTWDEIDPDNSVVQKDQARFKAMLNELGPALLRIRQGLQVGDYKSLAEHAEGVYPRYVNRRSPTAYMVIQSMMWGKLAIGQREQAVEPYLRCYNYLVSTEADGSLPGERRLRFDRGTALSDTLVPVWFDAAQAEAVLPDVIRAGEAIKPRPPGLYIYGASLAAAAGDPKMARTFLGPVQSGNPVIAQWRRVLEAQIEVQRGEPGVAVEYLESNLARFAPTTKPAALYWVGISQLQSDDNRTRREGVWRLLHLPALYGGEAPDLAGAGLYHSMMTLDELDDSKGSIALRKELLVNYAHTVHGQRIRTPSNPSSSN